MRAGRATDTGRAGEGQAPTPIQRERGRQSLGLAATLAALLAALVLLAGCGDDGDPGAPGDEPASIDLALDFFINPDHVGIYEALERGRFADAGLDVHPQVPSDPSAPIKQVVAGRVDIAVSYEPEVILARDQGLDVVAVAALVHGPLTSLISLPAAGIDSPSDLAGKTVVTAGIPYQAAYMETILAEAGVDPDSVKQVDVGLNLVQPLLSGKADAVLGAFLNIEGVQLERRGDDPRIVPVDEIGIPTYDELVLVVSGKRLQEDPEPIRRFLAALEQGTRDAAENPDGATEALLAASDALEPALTRAQVKATLPRLLPEREEDFGRMDPEAWERFAQFLADQSQIDAPPSAGEMLTNELLPGS